MNIKKAAIGLGGLVSAAASMLLIAHLYGASGPGPAGTGYWQQLSSVNPGIANLSSATGTPTAGQNGNGDAAP